MVIALDLLWALLVGPTGTLSYALVDEPAHLATCALVLLAVAALSGKSPPAKLAVPALLASVAIDLDHLPHYLGSEALTGTLPRPYTHSLVFAAGLALAAALWPRRTGRLVLAGLGLGIAAHLIRDLATGPGVPVLWPLSSEIVQVGYPAYVLALLGTAALALGADFGGRRALPSLSRRGGELAVLLPLIAGVVLISSVPAAQAKPVISMGAYIPGSDRDPALIQQFAQQTGRTPALLSFYRIWGPPLIDTGDLAAAGSNGSVPMLTWEPWDEDEHGTSLWSIAGGGEDGYISEAAREAAAWGGPIFLRFAHEMNGNWYPWGWGNDGNTPAAFKSAWRHLVDVFRGAGATNVRWVWCPYVSNVRLKQFRRFYPGDQYVDWTCLDGFNWGSYRGWQSFEEIFSLSYDSLVDLSRRPIMIGETGVNQIGGNKPRWLGQTLRRVLPKYTHVRAMVWFSAADDRADFRVDSSPRSLAAFRGALGQPLFAGDAARLLATPTRLAASRKVKKPTRRRGR
jgi:membrane-bound metal-dependent hydrolase YbcI (DUF457 family)